MYYLICACLHLVVSSIYCVVFLLCLSSSCVPYVASFSGLFIFYYPFGILQRLFSIPVHVRMCEIGVRNNGF
jgi:hypothetical protein